MITHKSALWLLLLSLIFITPVCAEDAFLPNMQRTPAEIKTENPPQHDLALPLPAWPQDTDLIELTLDGSATPFRYFIDSKQLVIDKNAVVRYVIVIESRSGGRNLSYEGIRCSAKGQAKTFAYGVNNQFIAAPDPNWQPLSQLSSAQYQTELWRFHFCHQLEFKPRLKTDIFYSLNAHRPH
jgi:hypothetical protein